MTYQSIFRNQLTTGDNYSAFSRPHQSADSTYSIHLVKAEDPAYIPGDFEVWPLFSQAIIEAFKDRPDMLNVAVDAVKKTKQELRGLQNRDIPPGTRPKPPRWTR